MNGRGDSINYPFKLYQIDSLTGNFTLPEVPCGDYVIWTDGFSTTADEYYMLSYYGDVSNLKTADTLRLRSDTVIKIKPISYINPNSDSQTK
jgi:hypothetical protein